MARQGLAFIYGYGKGRTHKVDKLIYLILFVEF